jgi:hypothetical protein
VIGKHLALLTAGTMDKSGHKLVSTDPGVVQCDSVRFREPRVAKAKGLSEALAIGCVGALLLCIVAPLLRHTAGNAKKALTAGKVLRSALPDDTSNEHPPTISIPSAGVTFSLDTIFRLSFSPSLLKHTFFALKPLPGRAPPVA